MRLFSALFLLTECLFFLLSIPVLYFQFLVPTLHSVLLCLLLYFFTIELSFLILLISLISLFTPWPLFSSGTNSCSAVALWSVLRGTWNLHCLSLSLSKHILFLLTLSVTDTHTHTNGHTLASRRSFYLRVPVSLLFAPSARSHYYGQEEEVITRAALPSILKLLSKQLVCIMPWLVR